MEVLQEKIRKTRCPLVLTMNLQPGEAPSSGDREAWAAAVLEAAAETVPAVSFDPLWYADPGGAETLRRLMAKAKELGLYVLIRSLRCDGEEEAALSAAVWFDCYGADGLCVSAFAGSDGICPLLPRCGEKSLFVLARSANRSAREVQDLLSGDRVIHTALLDLIQRRGGDRFGASGYGPVGAMAAGPALAQLRSRYDRLFFLVPSGGSVKGACDAFDQFGHGAALETPRSLLQSEGLDGFRAALTGLQKNIRRYIQVMG